MGIKTRQIKSVLKIALNPEHIKFIINRISSIFRKEEPGDYTSLGDDVIPGLNGKFKNPNKSLWFNLGYWKEARTYPEACADLARYVGQKANFTPQDSVLDVGFGYAEQDVLWCREFAVSKIVGVNITPLQVDVAKQRIEKLNLSDKIELHVGSGTDLQFADNSFDKIIALDCAYHFNTREVFLKQAYRLLKKGGLLITSEVLPSAKDSYQGILKKINRKIMHIPDENMYDKEEYVRKLENIGFRNVEFSSIKNYVFPGMFKYTEQRCAGKQLEEVVIELSSQEMDDCVGIELWQHAGIGDYVVFVAQKL